MIGHSAAENLSLWRVVWLVVFNVGVRGLCWAVFGCGWSIIVGAVIGLVHTWGQSAYGVETGIFDHYVTAIPYGAAIGAVMGVIHSLWVIGKHARAELRKGEHAAGGS